MRAGDIVRWASEVKTVGPSKEVVVSPGDICEVIGYSGKDQLWLSGAAYGAVHPDNVEVIYYCSQDSNSPGALLPQ